MVLESTGQNALLQWVNTFPFHKKARSFVDLGDGKLLAYILADIYPDDVPPNITEYKPLKTVASALFQNMRRANAEDFEPLLESQGLKAIAQNGKPDHIVELVAALLMAAVYSADVAKYLTVIQEDLPQEMQSEIMQIIQAIQKDPTYISTPLLISGADDLKTEAQITALTAEKQNLEKRLAICNKEVVDVNDRVDRLQETNEKMKEDLERANDEIRGLSKGGDVETVLQNLKDRTHEQEELIYNLEQQAEVNRIEKERLLEQARAHKNDASQLQDLKDELAEKNENIKKLQIKANRSDNLLKKLDSLNDIDKENSRLKRENEDLEHRLKELLHTARRNEQLERSQKEFEGVIQTQEQSIDELRRQKELLQSQKSQLTSAVQVLEDKKTMDEEVIEDLQKRLRGEVDLNHYPLPLSSPVAGTVSNNLDSELSGNKYSLRMESLQAQNQELKRNVESSREARLDLIESEAARKQLATKYEDLFEKHVIAEQQVTAILNASTSEGLVKGVEAALMIGELAMLTPEYHRHEAFAALRKTHIEASEKLTETEKKLFEAQAELESTKRDLLVAQNDLNMIEQSDLDALQSLKNTQETITISLENELTSLKARYKVLDLDHQQLKSQLVNALLSKDEILKSSSLKLEATDRSKVDNDVKSNLESLQRVEEQLIHKDRIVQELQAQVKALEEGGVESGVKATLEKENFNLKREHTMMSTAWFDLTRRLQSNSVVLQRRADMPRSWVNQQRVAVGAGGRR